MDLPLCELGTSKERSSHKPTALDDVWTGGTLSRKFKIKFLNMGGLMPEVGHIGRSAQMAAYLTLEGAKILEIQGFGGGRPSSGLHTIQLEDEGVFAVYSKGMFGGLKKIYWSSFGKLEFHVGTVAVQTGGGWEGGGFGIGGAIKGAATASLLNALTTKNREYAVLTVIDTDFASGAQKVFSMGFQNIDEAALITKLAQAIPSWTEPVVKTLEAHFKQCTDKDEAVEFIDVLNVCLERGILSEAQADRIFVLLKDIVPEAFPKLSPQISSGTTRVEQLKILSDLRSSGALSEEEFQAEKRVLLA
jgi:hypothetical protein